MTPAAHCEVLSLAVPLLADLPAEATLAFHVTPGGTPGVTPGVTPGGTLLLTTSRAAYDAHAARGEFVLAPLEYEALAEALADGRLTTRGALEELRRKARDPQHRIERERLMRGVVQADVPRGGPWTFGDLAIALGATLVGVEVHGDA